jgi:hypothetical protein
MVLELCSRFRLPERNKEPTATRPTPLGQQRHIHKEKQDKRVVERFAHKSNPESFPFAMGQ